jgi:predicted Zn-dependent protease
VIRKAAILAGALALAALVPLRASAQQDEETQMGAQLFDQLKAQGEIVATSPLYDRLRPISDPIGRAVQPHYAYPIHFYIVHEQQPNAFAAPGGNVYVTDSLMYFVRNTEVLAGTLCHETSHLIHHDSLAKMKDEQAIRQRAIAATILLGPSIKLLLATVMIGNLDALHYSRDVEERADITGSDTCAAANYNPWGLVWLFQDFSNSRATPPEILSDHPNDAHRIALLEQHFRDNPSRFARFDSNPKSAAPLVVAKNEPETFLK